MKFVKTALLTMKWVFNTVFIAFPWVIISIILFVFNVILNIVMNKWWAYGNFWLIFNTFFAAFQTVLSWPLVFEIPSYLRHVKILRWISCFWALIYNSTWYGYVLGFLA